MSTTFDSRHFFTRDTFIVKLNDKRQLPSTKFRIMPLSTKLQPYIRVRINKIHHLCYTIYTYICTNVYHFLPMKSFRGHLWGGGEHLWNLVNCCRVLIAGNTHVRNAYIIYRLACVVWMKGVEKRKRVQHKCMQMRLFTEITTCCCALVQL